MPRAAKKPSKYVRCPADAIGVLVFDSVSAFFERQGKPGGHLPVDWKSDAKHRAVFNLMAQVRAWWRVEKPKLEKEQSKLPTGKLHFIEINCKAKIFKIAEPTKKAAKAMKRLREIDAQIESTETRLLVAIMKDRAYLWD